MTSPRSVIGQDRPLTGCGHPNRLLAGRDPLAITAVIDLAERHVRQARQGAPRQGGDEE